eukprot:2833284-Amphidinium_carterae.1
MSSLIALLFAVPCFLANVHVSCPACIYGQRRPAASLRFTRRRPGFVGGAGTLDLLGRDDDGRGNGG